MTGRTQSGFSQPPQRNLRLIILTVLTITAAGIFYVYTIIAADFDQGAILIPGIMFAVLFLALTWGTKMKKLKFTSAAVAAVIFIASGLLFIQVGKYNQRVNKVMAGHILSSVGHSLEKYQADGNPLPDCIWKCMAKELMEKGYWTGIEIPYKGTDEKAAIGSIPKLDGWFCRYRYEKNGDDNFTLISSGRDRRFFTEDDLVYKSGQGAPELSSLPVFMKN